MFWRVLRSPAKSKGRNHTIQNKYLRANNFFLLKEWLGNQCGKYLVSIFVISFITFLRYLRNRVYRAKFVFGMLIWPIGCVDFKSFLLSDLQPVARCTTLKCIQKISVFQIVVISTVSIKVGKPVFVSTFLSNVRFNRPPPTRTLY